MSERTLIQRLHSILHSVMKTGYIVPLLLVNKVNKTMWAQCYFSEYIQRMILPHHMMHQSSVAVGLLTRLIRHLTTKQNLHHVYSSAHINFLHKPLNHCNQPEWNTLSAHAVFETFKIAYASREI